MTNVMSCGLYLDHHAYYLIIVKTINPRTTRGGGVGTTPPWRFSPITFLMIPTGKIASVYLLLGIEDTFWHM